MLKGPYSPALKNYQLLKMYFLVLVIYFIISFLLVLGLIP